MQTTLRVQLKGSSASAATKENDWVISSAHTWLPTSGRRGVQAGDSPASGRVFIIEIMGLHTGGGVLEAMRHIQVPPKAA